MNNYRIEYVGKFDKIGGGMNVEFETIWDAAEFAYSKLDLELEVLSITKVQE